MRNKIYGGVPGQKWALIVGPDTSNPDWGLTLFYQPKPAAECDGISTAWRHVWRVNIRWPITFRHQKPKSFPGRFQNARVVQKTLSRSR